MSVFVVTNGEGEEERSSCVRDGGMKGRLGLYWVSVGGMVRGRYDGMLFALLVLPLR